MKEKEEEEEGYTETEKYEMEKKTMKNVTTCDKKNLYKCKTCT